MLPGLGFSELVLLGVIALLVVGPKDLPLMMRKLGRQMAKFRALANEFRTGFDELARQAELDELKKEVEALRHGQMFSDIEAEAMKPYETAAFGDPPPPTDMTIVHDTAEYTPEPAAEEAPATTPETPAGPPEPVTVTAKAGP